MARIDPHSYFDPEQPWTKSIELKLDVDFETHTLRGEVRLHLEKASAGTMDLDTRGLRVHAVETGLRIDVPFELGEEDNVLGRRLRLTLPQGTCDVSVRYETSPEASGLQWLRPGQTAGKNHPFLYSLCKPHHARSLAPLQDSPRARVTFRAELIVPEALTAVMAAAPAVASPGPVPGTRTFAFEMPQPIPTYLLALAVGNLVSRELSPRTRIWAEPETVEAAAWEFADIERVITIAEGLFGPYPWERYDMLVLPPAFPYGGMENPRLTFLTPTLLAGNRSVVAVAVHELAHSWTGNLVTNATMNDYWLNEGFTVWAENRIIEALYGGDAAAISWAKGQKALKGAFQRFGEDSPFTRLATNLWGVNPDEVQSEVPYQKGARFLALMEKTVGRVRFDSFVREYIECFRFTSITTEEFLAFLDRKLPGLAAEVHAEAWIYGPGLPPNTPLFRSDRLDEIQTLSRGWIGGTRPSPRQVESFKPEEILVYLQGLPRSITEEECRWLDENFRLTGQGNYDILVEWLTIAASNHYDPTFPRLLDVLINVGRMKYLRSLYSALGATPRTRVLAQKVYAQAKPGYHILSQRVVEGILENSEAYEAAPPPSEETSRWIEAQLLRSGPILEPIKGGLHANVPHLLRVRIGPEDDQWLGGPIQDQAPFPEQMLPPDSDRYRLQVVFSEPNHSPVPQIRYILLPKGRGASKPCQFEFTPRGEIGVFEGRIVVLHQGRVLQTALLKGQVIHDGPEETSSKPLEVEIEAVIRPALSDLSERMPYGAALILNEGRDGSHQLTTITESAASLVSLDGMQSEIRAIQDELSKIADIPKRWFKGPNTPKIVSHLRYLAVHGRTLYDSIAVDSLGTSPLVSAQRIQVISARPESFLPLEFLYEKPIPSKHARLCPNTNHALKAGSCSHCILTDDSPSSYICPLGFWCLSKIVERHAHDPSCSSKMKGYDFSLQAEPMEGRNSLAPLSHALFAASNLVDAEKPGLIKAVKKCLDNATSHKAAQVTTWSEWEKSVKRHNPALLLLMPHTFLDPIYNLPTLEIAAHQHLVSAYIDEKHVRASPDLPPPLVLLLGCETSEPDLPFQSFVAAFRRKGAAVVIATLSSVLGRHVAPVAQFFIRLLGEVSGQTTVGELLVSLRRKALAAGLPMALCIVAYGDADWRVIGEGQGGHHVSH